MVLLLISLALSFVITVIGIYFKDDEKVAKEGTKKTLLANPKIRNVILILLNLVFLGVSFLMVKSDMKESDTLKVSVTETKKLLAEANDKMTKQSDVIVKGFADLKGQLSRQGVLSGGVDSRIKSLTVGIENYTNESRDLFSSLNQSLSAKTNNEFFVGSNKIEIPIGYSNTIALDTKNHLAIVGEENGVVTIRLNGLQRKLRPSEIAFFETDVKRKYKNLVYNGRVDDKVEFTITDR